ncbi:Exosome complex component Csl4 [Metallosphaera sp. J1]|uniref:exosome complex RNA-binding protein Csl4 n=1 Tax=Metallosphaera javensis (ex Hofmann et al. 2022) TaxID=99938 RepID=UPI001EE0BB39|nr:exosome complex RNA-binding protein Csl4 [Metallosphaera javensis (ex Hofmann et al. 2022)]MCG3109753.1 Exosome complex component Csl4 [Metallosphaera javensis (ex Hofmann et al. 2022)]
MGKQGDLTLPGDVLAVIEEFTPGEGCYELQGQVRASIIGKVFYDMINRKSNVIPEKKTFVYKLKKTKYVYGLVTSLKEDYAVVSVSSLEERFVSPSITGYLHISQVSQKHVKSLRDAVRPSDVIKAKPLSFTYPLQLSLRGKDLGVIVASCSVCGTVMLKVDEEHLRCPNCGNVETRRVGPYSVKGNGNRG